MRRILDATCPRYLHQHRVPPFRSDLDGKHRESRPYAIMSSAARLAARCESNIASQKSSSLYTSTTTSSYGCTSLMALTTALVLSSPVELISNLTSWTCSFWPRWPIAGVASGPGVNSLVPGMENETSLYSPMWPAPCEKAGVSAVPVHQMLSQLALHAHYGDEHGSRGRSSPACFTFSASSRGTYTTTLYF